MHALQRIIDAIELLDLSRWCTGTIHVAPGVKQFSFAVPVERGYTYNNNFTLLAIADKGIWIVLESGATLDRTDFSLDFQVTLLDFVDVYDKDNDTEQDKKYREYDSLRYWFP